MVSKILVMKMSGAVLSGSSLFTVNSEIFARILFSRIALKHIFATLKIRTKVVMY